MNAARGVPRDPRIDTPPSIGHARPEDRCMSAPVIDRNRQAGMRETPLEKGAETLQKRSCMERRNHSGGTRTHASVQN